MDKKNKRQNKNKTKRKKEREKKERKKTTPSFRMIFYMYLSDLHQNLLSTNHIRY